MRLLISTAIAMIAALVVAGPAIDLAAAPKNRPQTQGDNHVPDRLNNIKSDGSGPYQDGRTGSLVYIDSSTGAHFRSGAGNPGRKLLFLFDEGVVAALYPSVANNRSRRKSGVQAGAVKDGAVPTGRLSTWQSMKN